MINQNAIEAHRVIKELVKIKLGDQYSKAYCPPE
jgi:hypothetical protein